MAMINSLMSIVLGAAYRSFDDILDRGRVWLVAPVVTMANGVC